MQPRMIIDVLLPSPGRTISKTPSLVWNGAPVEEPIVEEVVPMGWLSLQTSALEQPFGTLNGEQGLK